MMVKSSFKNRICFLGAGNMAEALISGLIQSQPALRKNIIATDIRKERIRYLAGKYLLFPEQAMKVLGIHPNHAMHCVQT